MNIKKYLSYHIRWQMGFFILTPCMYLFIDTMHLPSWLAVILMQFIGAIVFYPIDNIIFKKKVDLKVTEPVIRLDRFINNTNEFMYDLSNLETIEKIKHLKNILINLNNGLLPKYLQQREIDVLKQYYGSQWFNVLGYEEPRYSRPL